MNFDPRTEAALEESDDAKIEYTDDLSPAVKIPSDSRVRFTLPNGQYVDVYISGEKLRVSTTHDLYVSPQAGNVVHIHAKRWGSEL